MRAIKPALSTLFATCGVLTAAACSQSINSDGRTGEPLSQGSSTALGPTASAPITSPTDGMGTNATPPVTPETVIPSATPSGSSTTPAPSTPRPAPVGTDESEPGEPEPNVTPEPEPPADPQPECTDTPPDDRETCATWAEWGECGAEWLAGFCHLSCDRCDTLSGDPEPATPGEPSPDGPSSPEPGGGPDTPAGLGDDNPYPPIEGGQDGWGSRYWDCCKPSCGWRANASSPTMSCGKDDNSLGVTDERNACEMGGQGGAFTCHNMAPWAYSTKVSYGFAAVNGVPCGSCYQIEFTGASHNAGADPGSAALAGKTMIIQATNIGGIQQNQFDLLIPGGGVGDFNGCSGQWGIDNSELGAQYGGFLPACKQSAGDHNGVKQCMRDKCEAVFGTRGLSELLDGCLWFVDWFEVADNPSFKFKQVSCPAELSSVSGSSG